MAKLIQFIKIILWVALATFLLVFSVNNRAGVALDLWPLDMAISLAPFHILFIGIFIGILITGSALSWLRLKEFTKRRRAERMAEAATKQAAAAADDLEAKAATDAAQMISATTSSNTTHTP